jgi:hypothetical protein
MPKHKLNDPKPKTVAEMEPTDYRESVYYKTIMETVLEFIVKKKHSTIGAISRQFREDITYPILDVLESLRKEGKVNFEQKGLITWVSSR